MPQLTEAELKLQRKKEEFKRKKEQQKLKEQATAAAKEEEQASAGASEAPATGLQTALQKAKAALARKSAQAKVIPGQDVKKPAAKKGTDPLSAAKQALEAKKKPVPGVKRPALKRPLLQRPAKPPSVDGAAKRSPHSTPPAQEVVSQEQKRRESDAEPSAAWDWEAQTDRPSREEARDERGAHEEPSRREDTVFVGDLPPFFTEEAIARLFSQFGPVSQVKLIRDYCYGFVKFADMASARGVVREFSQKPLTTQGHMLRIREAYGRVEGRQSDTYGDRSKKTRHEPIAAHPKVVEARNYGDRLAEELASAGAHGLNFDVRPQPRELVTYDDL